MQKTSVKKIILIVFILLTIECGAEQACKHLYGTLNYKGLFTSQIKYELFNNEDIYNVDISTTDYIHQKKTFVTNNLEYIMQVLEKTYSYQLTENSGSLYCFTNERGNYLYIEQLGGNETFTVYEVYGEEFNLLQIAIPS